MHVICLLKTEGQIFNKPPIFPKFVLRNQLKKLPKNHYVKPPDRLNKYWVAKHSAYF